MTRELSRFAIPPYWAEGLPREGDGSGEAMADLKAKAKASRAVTTGGVVGATGVTVTFVNEGSRAVDLYWRDPSGAGAAPGGHGGTHLQGTLEPGRKLGLDSHVGHAFVAVESAGLAAGEEGVAVATFVIGAGDNGEEIPVRSLAGGGDEL